MKQWTWLIKKWFFQFGAQKVIKHFWKLLSYPQEAILFHCFAGKDRTGIGAALILSALGVEHSYILEDYLKTNEQRKTANEQIIAQYQANGTPLAEIQQLETLLYVKKST